MKNRLLLVFLTVMLAVSLVALPLFSACSEEAPPAGEEEEEEEAEPEPIILTFASDQLETHAYSQADKAWMQKIEEETNGRVQFECYWGGSLLNPKEAMAQIEAGVADVGAIAVWEMAGLEVHKVHKAMYYGIPDTAVIVRVGGEIIPMFPFTEEPFASVKIMCRNVQPPPQLMTKEPIRKLEDLEGLQIRCPYKEVTQVLNELGAEGISIPSGEIYINLQKGIIDGAIGPFEMLKGLNLYEVVKYGTRIDAGTGSGPYRAMCWDTYNSLPPEIQKVFDDSVEFWSLEMTRSIGEANLAAIEFAEENGIEFIELSPEDYEQWQEYMEQVVLSEAQEVDAMGYPGTELFNEVRRLLEEYTAQ
jgi:TRAP-type C4-dicarboxylate transport system substrate-binding protein